MGPRDPVDVVLVAVACATGALLALLDRHGSALTAAAAYAGAWWLLRAGDARHRHPYR
jgi:hypothetical protein